MASTDLNCVVLVGRLTRDAELTYLQSGNAVAHLSIAVNRNRKENDQWVEEANYFDISLFGKSAENLKQYLTKGKQIAVQGSLKQDRWEKEGQKFSKVQIIANNVELLGGRSDNGGNSSSGMNPSGGYQARSYAPQQASMGQRQGESSAEPFGGDNGDFPEYIPF